jgi:hypothetical protein
MRIFLVSLSLLAFNFSPSLAVASTSEVAEAHTTGSWCVTPRHIFNISDIGLKKSVKESYCGSDGKIFHSRSAASAEYKRLTGSSYTGYSYSDKIWCVEKRDYQERLRWSPTFIAASAMPYTTYMPYGRCVARGGEVFASDNQAKHSLSSPAIASALVSNSLFDNPGHDPGWSSNSYWCVAKNRIWETTGWDCWRNNNGEYFTTRAEAEAEKNNLNWGK